MIAKMCEISQTKNKTFKYLRISIDKRALASLDAYEYRLIQYLINITSIIL